MAKVYEVPPPKYEVPPVESELEIYSEKPLATIPYYKGKNYKKKKLLKKLEPSSNDLRNRYKVDDDEEE
jgi:hypothetical protein